MKVFNIKNHDIFITLTAVILLLIGLVVIYSVTFTAKTPIEGYGTINRQLVFVFLGLFIYLIFSKIDPVYYQYKIVKIFMFVVIVGLLLYVKLFGDPVRNTNRWIEWGFIRIQPSEYAKIVLILLNSSFLSKVFLRGREKEIKLSESFSGKSLKIKFKSFIKNIKYFYPEIINYLSVIIISFVCIVLIFIEPALGNAAITFLICFALILISYPKQKELVAFAIIFILGLSVASGVLNLEIFYGSFEKYLIVKEVDIVFTVLSIAFTIFISKILRVKTIVCIAILLVGAGSTYIGRYTWDNVLKIYQKQRIETFLNPQSDPQGAGWHILQSKIAIGSGRLFGRGFLQGSQSKSKYLPEPYSDFIFAAYCEEFGLIGAVFLLSLYIFLVIRIINTAKLAESRFESLVSLGIAVMILLHVFINIGTNLGVVPITGIPLPLISYGGSSIMVTMMGLGIVQAINMHIDKVDEQESLREEFL